MSLGLTRGEIILVGFIFALVYLSGLLPKIAARLAGTGGGSDSEEGSKGANDGAKEETLPQAKASEE